MYNDFDGDRCAETQRLQVHHLHYNSVGCEQFDDVEVLCPLHHKVREVMKKRCDRCDECVFDNLEDAEDHINGYDDDWELDDIIADAPSLCPYCDHMCGKDD